MMTRNFSRQMIYALLLLIIVVSLPIKLAAARQMQWDIDIVPVLSRSVEYVFPPVGTLSSVAAFNMPMLQWLHLPALHLTHNAFLAILVTMLIWNILSTIAVFCIGDSLFNGRVGLIAALMFTFSEVGISSAYTAWAQLLLPGFYAMTFLFLWEWRRQEKGLYLALAGIVATAAFMTHFSAILLYGAMLVFAIVTLAKWQWGWLMGGAIVCLLMLMPFVAFDAQADFVNIRAFINRESRVSADVLREVQYLKPESGRLPRELESAPVKPPAANPQEQTPTSQNQTRPTQSSDAKPRWQRGIDFVLSIPQQFLTGLTFAFDTRLRVLPDIFRPVLFIPMAFFVVSSGWAIVGFWRDLSPVWERGFRAEGYKNLSEKVVNTLHGRVLLLLLFVLTIIGGLIVTRSINQPTYFMGLTGLQIVIAAAIFADDRLPRWMLICAVVLALSYAAVSMSDRSARLIQYDDGAYSRFNVSIYRHVSDAVDFIAADWDGGASITVSYDIMPEMRNLWWVAAWHSIDPMYRMGMNFDFLLAYDYGLMNTNTDAVGYIEEADYFVVYEPGLTRFSLDDYTLAQFGTIYVLKEK